MSVYRKLDPMAEDMAQFAFKGKREHIATAKTPNTAHPSQHINIEISHGSRVIVPDTTKITFNLEIESTDKTRSVVNNVGRALVKKRSSWLKGIDIINNSDIYDTYKELYLSKKRTRRKATSRHTVGQWLKSTGGR